MTCRSDLSRPKAACGPSATWSSRKACNSSQRNEILHIKWTLRPCDHGFARDTFRITGVHTAAGWHACMHACFQPLLFSSTYLSISLSTAAMASVASSATAMISLVAVIASPKDLDMVC